MVFNFQLWVPISTLPLTIQKKKNPPGPKKQKKRKGGQCYRQWVQMDKFMHVLITISNLEESLFNKQVRKGKGKGWAKLALESRPLVLVVVRIWEERWAEKRREVFSLYITSVLTIQEGFERATRDQHGLGFPFSFEGDKPSNLRATVSVIRSNGPDADAISINFPF